MVKPNPPTYALAILAAALILLLSFLIASTELQRESLWNDEGWSMWAVRDPDLPAPGGSRLSQLLRPARYVYTSVRSTLERVREDVHPPLYFLILDGWTMVTGRSVYAARMLAALLALIGLAATYALGKRLFDRPTGLMALVILGTAGFWVYYAREARMYSLLLALSALATWTYWRWAKNPTLRRGVVYGLFIGALLYTHYAGVLVVAAQVLHFIFTSVVGTQHAASLRKNALLKGLRPILPFALALILFAPWLPVISEQMSVHGGRPLAARLLTDWGVVAALLLVITSGHWGLMVAPFVLGNAIPRLRQHKRAVLLLVLWLLVTPVVLLAWNAWVSPVYQVRYVIGILPAGALLVAYGLRYVGDFSGFAGGGAKGMSSPPGVQNPWLHLFGKSLKGLERNHPNSQIQPGEGIPYIQKLSFLVPTLLLGGLVIWIVYVQLAAYADFWPGKPPWRETVERMIAARRSLEPAITDIAAYSAGEYYDELLGIRRGISLDLSWREHTSQEMRDYVALMDNAPSVWVVQPTNTGKTWDTVAALRLNRGIGYRDSVANVILYRFDKESDDKLDFRFGDFVHYDGDIGLRETVQQGGHFCSNLSLTTLGSLDGSYSTGLHVIAGYNVLLAQWDQGLETPEAGKNLDLEACMDIPANTPLGEHHLYLMIYKWYNPDERLPVVEHSEFYWGDVLVIGTVEVTSAEP